MIDGDSDAIFVGFSDGVMGGEVGRGGSLFCLSSWFGVIEGDDVVIAEGQFDGVKGSKVGTTD